MDTFLVIFLLLMCYVSFLLLIRILGVGKKEKCSTCLNCCPDCKNPMERIKRLKGDYIINYLTFHLFNYKRYRCMECGWEGLKWETPFKHKTR